MERRRDTLDRDKIKSMLAILYGKEKGVLDYQIKRYNALMDEFDDMFPASNGEMMLFSTPGRTEVGGNHTDHNGGRVLAAAVNLDSIAICRKNNSRTVNLYSREYKTLFTIELDQLQIQSDEEGTTAALIRGIAAGLKQSGYNIGGFDGIITSDVFQGSGLSSSASIEVLIATVFNHYYNEGRISPVQIAKIGQYAENEYFKKPCGLMDQIACSVGGFVAIDFQDVAKPRVRKLSFDFSSRDYSLLVVDTGGSHEDLTQDYADIPAEMRAAAGYLGKVNMSNVDLSDLMANISQIRDQAGDRAVLRALHFIFDNNRVEKQTQALEDGNLDDFLDLVNQSGNSSWKWLQNCYSTRNPAEQGVTLALAVTETFLATHDGQGACRVHGGGFAGTIQVYMPNTLLDDYVDLIEGIYGRQRVTVLQIRDYGSVCLNK